MSTAGVTATRSLGRRTGRAWDLFWYREGPTTALGLFRIGFAFCLLREVSTTLGRSIYAIEGRFHLPYADWIGRMSEDTYWLVHQAQVPLILLLGVGLLARPAAWLLLGLQGWVFFADQLNFRNHPYFFLLCLLALAVGPLDDALSVRRWIASRSDDVAALAGSVRPLTFQRLIQVQVSLSYLLAALQKTTPYYLSGAVLGRHLERDLLAGNSGALLSAMLGPSALARVQQIVVSPAILVAASGGVVALELFLAAGLWHRRTRSAAIVAGVLFHASIALIMNIRVFSLAMIVSYLLFLPPDTVRARVATILRAPRRVLAARTPG